MPSLPHHFHTTMQQAAGFEHQPTLAVAVSGGADSMALMWLAHDWAAKHGGKIVALTVNHNLRNEAHSEAEMVARQAAQLGIEHHTLPITIAEPSAAVQAQARTLRYQALEDFCHQHRILHLLTAHHQDDNIETLAMRAWRGSGVEGLSGIPFIRYTRQLRLLRPLLHTPKDALVQWLTSNHINWIDDPSNRSDDYERNRLRKHLTEWPVNRKQTQHFLTHMALANQAIQPKQAQLALDSIHLFPEGYLELDTTCWPNHNHESIISLLTRIIHSLGKGDTSPRYYQLGHLRTQLTDPQSKGCCLGGLQWTRITPHQWRITREIRALEGPTPLTSNRSHLWDNRFIIHCNTLPSHDYHIAALGEQGLSQLNLPRSVLLTLPAIWRLDQLCFLPHIEGNVEEHLNDLITLTPRYRRPLLGTPQRYLM